MSSLVERLAELRRYLDHLRALRPRISGAASLQHDLSLRNDVLFSLLIVCQLVIDVASELVERRGERLEDPARAVGLLSADPHFPDYLVRRLEWLPDMRGVVVHEHVSRDWERVLQALDELDDVREFMRIVSELERNAPTP